MTGILGGSQFVSTPSGWEDLIGGPSGLPRTFDGTWRFFGYEYIQTTHVVDGVHPPAWTRVMRVRYAPVVPPNIIPRNIVLSTHIGGELIASWDNDSSGYDIAFRVGCVEDPAYDIDAVELSAGSSGKTTVVDTAAGALGYHFRVFMNYMPDGDTVISGTIVGPTT